VGFKMIIDFQKYKSDKEGNNTTPANMADVLKLIIETLDDANEQRFKACEMMANRSNKKDELLKLAQEIKAQTDFISDFGKHFLRLYKFRNGIEQ